jgi:alpha-galactosidase
LREIIAVDPDVVYFRSRNNLLTADQRRLLVDLAHVCGFRAVSDPIDWLDSGERTALEAFLGERPAVEQLDRNRFTIADRSVDFGPVIEERPW